MQAVTSALLVAAAAEAQLPILNSGLYSAGYAAAAPYAAAYAAPVAVDAKFAYGAPVTALNAVRAAGPIAAAPVAAYAAAPAVAAVAAPAVATYAAAPAVAAPAVASYAAAPAVAAAPVAAYAAAPAVAAAPIAAPASSQFQAQDEFGNIAYGYQNINSAKTERGNAYGGVTGSYTYADEAGVHTVNYVADALGFRVAGDNLPVGPANIAVAPVHQAAPVVDTPEVVEAKAAFFQAYEAAKAGIAKRSADAQYPLNYALPYAGYAGYGYAAPAVAATYAAAPAVATTYAAAPAVAATYAAAPVAAYAAAPAVAATYAAAPAVAAPVAAYAAAPAVAAAPAREALLTTIKLNPGHATFYRVD